MEVDISFTYKVYNFAWLAHSAGPSYTLQVFLGGLSILKLDDVAYIHCVKAPGAQIITDKHRNFAFVKQVKCAITHLETYLLCVFIKR